MIELRIDRIDSAIRTLLIVADGERLCVLDYPDYEERMRLLLLRQYGEFQLREVAGPNGFSSQIQAYFDGDMRGIDAIPVSMGGTDFRQQVWTALRAIPPGSVLSRQDQS